MYHLNLNLAKEEQEKVSSKNSTNSKTNGKQKQKKKNNITPSQSPEEKRYYDSAIKYLLEAHKWNVLLQGKDSPDSRNTRNYLETHNISININEFIN